MENLKRNICTIIILMIVLISVCTPSFANNLADNVNGKLNTVNQNNLNDSGDEEDFLNNLNKINKAQIEESARESVLLACASVRLAIALSISEDSEYSAIDNIENISKQMVKILNGESADIKETDWKAENISKDGTFNLIYKNEYYKKVCEDENAKIIFNVVATKNRIAVEEQPKDENIKHNFKKETTQEATCATVGIILYTCIDCDYSYTEEIPMVEHKYTETIKTKPSCIAMGEKIFVCSNCKGSYTEKMATVDHDYEERMRTEAGCEKDGVVGYICRTCGDMFTKVIEKAKGHTYNATTKQATCTTNGKKTYTCVRCPETYTKVISTATGHNYEEEITEDGIKKYTCINCNNSYTDKATTTDSEQITTDSEYKILDNKIFIVIGVVIFVLIIIIVVPNVIGKRD